MHINNKKINLPPIKIVDRKFNREIFNKARMEGLSPIAAKILANRKFDYNVDLKNIINPTMKSVNLDIYKLKDIEKAADRISNAIINGETIALLCDFDVDGISSAAVLYSSFVDYFQCDPTKIKILISHRMMYGYGFRQEILEEIVNSSIIPTLLITADQGSSDEERIKSYNEIMIKKGYKDHAVIVTDHHHIKGKGPQSAFAVVNPQRHDDEFIDKTICGCAVALFTMVATRDSLIKKNHLNGNIPKLTNLLTYATAATIADCVDMSSVLNRAIVNKGLLDINNGTIPAWKIMKTDIVGNKPITSSSIGFGLGPRINACSRTGGDGLVALKYYLSENESEAKRYLTLLETMNEDRKKIEKKLVLSALIQASDLYTKGHYSLVIYLPEGHHGVHGIASSRITEKYGRPTIIFSPKEEVVIEENNKKIKKVITVTGSGRSIEGVDLTYILDKIEEKEPNLFLGKGGHEMAAGMSIRVEDIPKLRDLFEIEVKSILKEEPFPKILIDGELKENTFINFDLLDQIRTLEPYGNGFEEPIFKAKVFIQKLEIQGTNKDTLRITFIHNGYEHKGVIFKYDQHPNFGKIFEGQIYTIAFNLTDEYFNGRRKLNILIKYVEL